MNESYRFKQKMTLGETKPLGRVVLNSENSVDWDLEPTLYQAVSVAHGHLLHFKSEWIADGYSLEISFIAYHWHQARRNRL
ncbi:hypothetical protein PGH45_15820 [Legionella pneumophila]|nr:hypothetical protein [Legionella pneumophila]